MKNEISIYQVDTFTSQLFRGNPAAVCILSEWLSDQTLYSIAKENNLPVTAFLVVKNDKYHIRWITPEDELDLCGHGSLAAGYVIFNFIDKNLQETCLHSRTEELPIIQKNNLITLNFPEKNIALCNIPLLEQGFGLAPKEIYQQKNERCVAVFDSEKTIRELQPDMQILRKLEHRGIIITARGTEADFVSRTFYPRKGISEDPVTGSSHCLLAPFWSERLGKSNLLALQLSERRGEIFCEYKNGRVLISGEAVLYMQGTIYC